MKTHRSVSPPDSSWYDARDLMRSLLERGGLSHERAVAVTDEIESREVLSAAIAAIECPPLINPFEITFVSDIRGLC